MNGQIVLNGMILSAMPVGENDKRLVVLTMERGRITAFAKGARRPNSALLAAAQPFSFGKFYLFEGKNSYTMVNAEISNYFMEIRNDLERVTYGMYILELADYYTRENSDEKEVLKLVYQSMRALCVDGISNHLIRCIYELKLIAINGEVSTLRECMCCGSDEQLIGVSIQEGMAVCDNCKGSVKDVVPLSSSAIYTMQYVIYSSIEKLYSFTLTDEVLKELEYVMKRYVGRCVDREMKSDKMLDIF